MSNHGWLVLSFLDLENHLFHNMEAKEMERGIPVEDMPHLTWRFLTESSHLLRIS